MKSDEEDIGLDSPVPPNLKKQKMDEDISAESLPKVPPPDILKKMLGDWEGTMSDEILDLYLANPEAFCDAITTETFIIEIGTGDLQKKQKMDEKGDLDKVDDAQMKEEIENWD